MGRCDRSESEAAVVLVARQLHELEFCAHHYRVHELALMAAGWKILEDQRETLLPVKQVTEATS